ncbi:MAG: hypothetical protein ACI85O_001102 [Saprospiraceae bacterium]|jgi:hypothetical protein
MFYFVLIIIQTLIETMLSAFNKKTIFQTKNDYEVVV